MADNNQQHGPVKVPSDGDLFTIHDEFFPTMVIGHDHYLRFARALLARYGQPAQPAASAEPVKRAEKPDDHVWVKCSVCGTIAHQYFDYCGMCCGKVLSRYEPQPADEGHTDRDGYPYALNAAPTPPADGETPFPGVKLSDFPPLPDCCDVGPRCGNPVCADEPLDVTERFIADVTAELKRARAKFPGDRIMTIALAEEFGELAKAMLDEPGANVWKEAVQTAVMAARVAVDGDSSVDEWRAAKGLDNHRNGGLENGRC